MPGPMLDWKVCLGIKVARLPIVFSERILFDDRSLCAGLVGVRHFPTS